MSKKCNNNVSKVPFMHAYISLISEIFTCVTLLSFIPDYVRMLTYFFTLFSFTLNLVEDISQKLQSLSIVHASSWKLMFVNFYKIGCTSHNSNSTADKWLPQKIVGHSVRKGHHLLFLFSLFLWYMLAGPVVLTGISLVASLDCTREEQLPLFLLPRDNMLKVIWLLPTKTLCSL